HSPVDNFVGIENAGQIFGAAKHPKSFVSLDNAHHLLFGKRDADYAANVIANWAVRYLDLTEEAKPKPLPAGVVEVEEKLTTRLAQSIRVGSHELTADEPESVPGGADTGPTPYDYLLSALGACTAMTVRMYADLKRLPLERVRVRLQHERRGEGVIKTDYIHRRIHFEGDLDDTVRAKLLEIANKCPVHRTLHGKIEVETVEDTEAS
ncbi:MAG: OsmC family protein, partial [Alphaproteobacteria bacterium]|nr:OsmC family protein [Alphaproteobacteria bacterium]